MTKTTYLKSLQSLSIPFSSPLPLALVGSFSSPTFISWFLSSSNGETLSCASAFSLPSWVASPAPCIYKHEVRLHSILENNNKLKNTSNKGEWKTLGTYVAAVPVASLQLVTRGRAQHILHHAHPQASTF